MTNPTQAQRNNPYVEVSLADSINHAPDEVELHISTALKVRVIVNTVIVVSAYIVFSSDFKKSGCKLQGIRIKI